MANSINRKISKDLLWKSIVEDCAEPFVSYFFPSYAHQIDFSRGLKPQEQEKDKLLPEAESKRRHADKLFKGYLKEGGGEVWFLLYFEAQGYADADFARRVYQVSYRIYDYYGLPPAVLVLYTDKRRKHHYREFSYSFFGTELEYRFPTFALIDYQTEELDRDGNIFGLALQAAREELSLQGKGLDLQRLEVKLRLLRRLLGMKVPKDNIRVLADFINYYIGFENPELYDKFDQTFSQLTKKSQAMGVTETILHEMEKKITRAVTKRVKQQLQEQMLEEKKQMLEEMEAERKRAKAESERAKAESERAKAESERAKVESERAKVESERAKVESERAKVESERAKVEATAKAEAASLKMLEMKERSIVLRAWKKGMPIEEIAELTEMTSEKVKRLIQELAADDSPPDSAQHS
jgi:DNA-directed RNA polymerase specialized sigma24 family protein